MKPPLFVLTCIRSFSSVVSNMLGQHPQTYGLPELNLLLADTLGEVIDRLETNRPQGLNGLLRTIAELEYQAQTQETIRRARAATEAFRRRACAFPSAVALLSNRLRGMHYASASAHRHHKVIVRATNLFEAPVRRKTSLGQNHPARLSRVVRFQTSVRYPNSPQASSGRRLAISTLELKQIQGVDNQSIYRDPVAHDPGATSRIPSFIFSFYSEIYFLYD